MTATQPFIPPAPVTLDRNGIMLPVDQIDSTGRIREVTEAGAAMMADSIAAKGLISPILVRPGVGGGFRVVIGGHRIAAVRLLGWAEIRCDVRDLDDDEAEDLELRENLDRTDLTKLDQMIFLARRKALDDRAAARQRAGGDRKSATADHFANVGEMIPRFTQELAEQVGRSERAVQRAIQIVENLDTDAIKLLRGTKHADNEQSLLKLSQRTPAQQRALATQMRDGGAKTIAQASLLAGFEEVVATEDPQKTYLGQLERAWDLADPTTRLTFLQSIDAAYLTVPPSPTTETTSASPSRGGRKPAKGTH